MEQALWHLARHCGRATPMARLRYRHHLPAAATVSRKPLARNLCREGCQHASEQPGQRRALQHLTHQNAQGSRKAELHHRHLLPAAVTASRSAIAMWKPLPRSHCRGGHHPTAGHPGQHQALRGHRTSVCTTCMNVSAARRTSLCSRRCNCCCFWSQWDVDASQKKPQPRR